MAHLTSFEIALMAVTFPAFIGGIINFIWNISLKHYKDKE